MDIDQQEVSNASRRFRSSGDQEDRSQAVYPMPSTPGEDEQRPPDFEPETQDHLYELLIWFVRFTTIGYTTIVMARILSDEEVRLQLMHASIRMFQTMARIFGGWALKTEKAYNEYVETLH